MSTMTKNGYRRSGRSNLTRQHLHADINIVHLMEWNGSPCLK